MQHSLRETMRFLGIFFFEEETETKYKISGVKWRKEYTLSFEKSKPDDLIVDIRHAKSGVSICGIIANDILRVFWGVDCSSGVCDKTIDEQPKIVTFYSSHGRFHLSKWGIHVEMKGDLWPESEPL